MKTTVNSYDFHRAFEQLRPNNFSYEGLDVLFDYFEELEDGTGEEIELDVIAICCDFAESDYKEIAQDFNIDIEDMDEDEAIEAVREYIEDNGQLVGETCNGTSFIYANM